ncbi:hypothetical protein [Proteiniphilum sp.]|uniref:hypothetical protein n=1 Tax=Proteiniphilum sp. TaxID=1926877 RepID=UPI002B20C519|nr:hypothetical protein [Proteiniphilum sp.]MEA4916415.1 hypothetical protein [Proteiniphilum sp.]
MKYINLFSFILILVVTAGCSREYDYRISNSVFIEDNENPGLPIYSEKGYNSFGVYWGLSPLTTRNLHDPSKIVVKDDSCHLYFSGSTGYNGYTLVISLPDYTPQTFTDLLSLHGKEYNLASDDCTVSLSSGNQTYNLKILEGTFKIKRAQKMFVDKEIDSTILSGTFSFKSTVNDQPATFSNGRFDMRFANENFYYLSED